MAHTDAGPCFSHELTGLVILSLVTAHSLVTPHMDGPHAPHVSYAERVTARAPKR